MFINNHLSKPMKPKNLRLIQVREHLGLQQNEMARVLSMKASSYNQIESGRNNVSPRVATILKLTYNVNPNWLETGEGEMMLPGKKKYDNDALKEIESRCAELQEEVARYKRIIDTLTGK
jgi:DNA-binding XRE family transcriptional regulator